MSSKRNYRIFLEITTILCAIHLQWCCGSPNSVRISAIIPPPQVLLPPHREEGQSLDDIIYFGGGSGVVATTPRSFTSSNSKSNNNRNVNVAQTFLPPPAPPIPVPPRPHTFSTLLSASPPPSRNSASATSGEEIKVPQTLKHRTPARKQYTKADLIAAANSLRPAGFDFNRVLVLNPSFFTNSSGTKTTNNNNANKKSAGTARAQAQTTQKNGHDLSQLYQHIMFPLPLFDTPVYNELKPLMEMLMRQGKFGKFSVGGGSGNDGKVLVILPKSMLNHPSTASSATSVRSVPTKPKPTGNTKATTLQPRKLQHHTSASTPKPLFQKNFSTSRPIPSTGNTSGSGASAKVIIVPKGNRKISTTSKPKTKASPVTPGTRPTKRVAKLTSLPGKKVGKGPDLQVAATSNKLSQRPAGRKLPSSSESSDKRSYSFSKGGEKYSFSYAVKNDEFKDVKSHSESRDGDMVAGEYSMLEPDGYTRVVTYSVLSDSGFKASVKRIPPS